MLLSLGLHLIVSSPTFLEGASKLLEELNGYFRANCSKRLHLFSGGVIGGSFWSLFPLLKGDLKFLEGLLYDGK